DVEAVSEEGAVARVRARLGVQPADGEDHLFGLAGEQVAAAGPAIDQQSVACGALALDARAVRWRRARHHPAGLLLDPAEGRDVEVGAEQDAGLARAGLGRQVWLTLDQAVGLLDHPARHVRRVAV